MSSFYASLRHTIYVPFSIFRKNSLLFFGMALFLYGIMNFSNGKYCDGNSADYYSCTNTAVYYYYAPLSLVACILGSFFVAIWKLKREEN